jgi:Ni,Fe-hydrogenase III small subunit
MSGFSSKLGFITSTSNSTVARGLPGVNGQQGATGPQGPQGVEGSVGSIELNDINNVDTVPSGGDTLRYDSGSSTWFNTPMAFEIANTRNTRTVGTSNAFLSSPTDCAFIAGTGCSISGGVGNFISGVNNSMTGASSRCVIIGYNNSIETASNSSILSGVSNVVSGCNNSSIIAGNNLSVTVSNTALSQNLEVVGNVTLSQGAVNDGFLKGNSSGLCSWSDAPESGVSFYDGTLEASATGSKTVSFSKTYNSAPKVVVCLSGGDSATRSGVFISVTSITTTSFDVYISNQRGTSIVDPTFYWISL